MRSRPAPPLPRHCHPRGRPTPFHSVSHVLPGLLGSLLLGFAPLAAQAPGQPSGGEREEWQDPPDGSGGGAAIRLMVGNTGVGIGHVPG